MITIENDTHVVEWLIVKEGYYFKVFKKYDDSGMIFVRDGYGESVVPLKDLVYN